MSFGNNRRSEPVEPRWLTARYNGKCVKCQSGIRRGDRIYWIGKGKVCCETCGTDLEREHLNGIAGEEQYTAHYWGEKRYVEGY